MPILGDFAVKYAAQAESLGVDTEDLYQALVDTAENTVRRLVEYSLPSVTEARLLASGLVPRFVVVPI